MPKTAISWKFKVCPHCGKNEKHVHRISSIWQSKYIRVTGSESDDVEYHPKIVCSSCYQAILDLFANHNAMRKHREKFEFGRTRKSIEKNVNTLKKEAKSIINNKKVKKSVIQLKLKCASCDKIF